MGELLTVTTQPTKRKMMGLPEAARFCAQVLGIPVSPATLWRYSTKGFRGIRMATECLGARCFVTEENIRAFMRELSERRASLYAGARGSSPGIPMPSDEALESFAAGQGINC